MSKRHGAKGLNPVALAHKRKKDAEAMNSPAMQVLDGLTRRTIAIKRWRR